MRGVAPPKSAGNLLPRTGHDDPGWRGGEENSSSLILTSAIDLCSPNTGTTLL